LSKVVCAAVVASTGGGLGRCDATVGLGLGFVFGALTTICGRDDRPPTGVDGAADGVADGVAGGVVEGATEGADVKVLSSCASAFGTVANPIAIASVDITGPRRYD
jgi:hypothetical protein